MLLVQVILNNGREFKVVATSIINAVHTLTQSEIKCAENQIVTIKVIDSNYDRAPAYWEIFKAVTADYYSPGSVAGKGKVFKAY